MTSTHHEGARSSRRALRSTQLVLCVLVAGIILAGREERFWPVTGWPLYEAIYIPRPDPTVSTPTLRVTLHDGTRFGIRAYDLVPHTRVGLVHTTLDWARAGSDTPERTKARAYLAYLLARKLNSDQVDSIRIEETVWTVRTDRVPPVSLKHPVMTVPVDSFAVPR